MPALLLGSKCQGARPATVGNQLGRPPTIGELDGAQSHQLQLGFFRALASLPVALRFWSPRCIVRSGDGCGDRDRFDGADARDGLFGRNFRSRGRFFLQCRHGLFGLAQLDQPSRWTVRLHVRAARSKRRKHALHLRQHPKAPASWLRQCCRTRGGLPILILPLSLPSPVRARRASSARRNLRRATGKVRSNKRTRRAFRLRKGQRPHQVRPL